ncbi:Coiled-coil and C2 domain-containing protein 1A [Irineochytrium annulatum]|nr:Coiled-coil and C2 domain-containing protein 1A [Irineochytrium annulatum]
MSWFGGKKPSAAPRTPAASGSGRKSSSTASFDFDFDPDAAEDFGDLENDAGLLAELDGLKASMGLGDPAPSKPKAKSAPVPVKAAAKPQQRPPPQAAPPPAAVPVEDVDELITNLPGLEGGDGDEDIHVELTDADMNDPDLLAQLQAVGGDPLTDGDDTTHDEQHLPISEPAATVNDSSVTVEDALACQNPHLLLKYADLERARASSATDPAAAAQHRSNASAIADRHDALVRASEGHPSVSVRAQDVAADEPMDEPPEPSPPPKPTVDLSVVRARSAEYRRAAVEYKRAGDMTGARRMLTTHKELEAIVANAEMGKYPPPSYAVPGPPPPPEVAPPPQPKPVVTAPAVSPASSRAATGAKGKTAASPAAKVAVAVTPSAPADLGDLSMPVDPSKLIGADLTTTLKAHLDAQITLCGPISSYYLKKKKAAKSGGDEHQQLALRFHQLKKTMQMDLVTLAAVTGAKGHVGFRFERVEYQIEVSNADVEMDEMAVEVVRGIDFGGAGGGSELQTVVGFDMGWPGAEDARAAEGKGQTVLGKGASPDYGFAKRIKVERTRAFQRYLDRKRAVFDVMVVSRQWGGLFAKQVCVGRASVRLDALLKRCEVHEVVELTDPANPRKLTGGKLEVRIRVRVPLMEPEVVVRKERWMFPVFNQAPAVAPAPSLVVPLPAVEAQAPVTAVEPAAAPASEKLEVQKVDDRKPEEPKPVEPKPPVPKTELPSKEGPKKVEPSAAPTKLQKQPEVGAAKDEDIESMEIAFLNPETIVSNMVLEEEHTALLAKIATYGKAVPEELADRKMGYEFRMNMLVTNVQLGLLTMDDYIASVKIGIAACKKQALAFKHHGKMDLAKQAMKRIKLMTDEVEEVERAIAGGEL